MPLFPLALLGLMLLLPTWANAALSDRERAIAAHTQTTTPNYLALLAQLVNTPSGTQHHDGVRAVGEIMARELTRLGFETQWVTLPAEVQRAGHLIATRHRGSDRPILLLGHLDTVFDNASPAKRFAIDAEGKRATGHGVQDMKGGLVMMLQALDALHQNGVLDSLSVTVALMGDEEKTGRPSALSRAPLVAHAKAARLALGFEFGAAQLADSAVIARRGLVRWQLALRSPSAHSSLQFSPDFGAGAILTSASLLQGLYEHVRQYPDMTFNPGIMLAGSEITYDPAEARGHAYGKTNVIASEAQLEGDLRFLDPTHLEALRAAFGAQIKRVSAPASASLTWGEVDPSMPATPEHQGLLDTLSEVSEDLGLGPVSAQDPLRRGTADIAYVAHLLPSLDGLGAIGGGAHTEDEYLDLAAYPRAVQRVAILLSRLAPSPTAP